LLLTCATTIISLEPYALNAEFQDFIPRFNKNFFTYALNAEFQDFIHRFNKNFFILWIQGERRSNGKMTL
jgi:hypothetical protein